MENTERPVGVILAGGRSHRMGEEKSLIKLAGVSLLQRTIDGFSDQVGPLVLSANGDVSRFEGYKLPVIRDHIEGYKGPLAGLLTGMRWTVEHHPTLTHIASIASDTPFFPGDLVETLVAALDGEENMIAVPQTFERLHPVCGIWPVSLVGALEESLSKGQFGVHDWLRRQSFVAVEFPTGRERGADLDPFFNINDRDDLIVAAAWLENHRM